MNPDADISIPAWVVTLIGRLTLEAQIARQQRDVLLQQLAPPTPQTPETEEQP